MTFLQAYFQHKPSFSSKINRFYRPPPKVAEFLPNDLFTSVFSTQAIIFNQNQPILQTTPKVAEILSNDLYKKISTQTIIFNWNQRRFDQNF